MILRRHTIISLELREAPRPWVNNLMVYETAVWAARRVTLVITSGGASPAKTTDSLFRFKAGFSGLRAPLYTYFCVRNPAVYDLLCDRKRRLSWRPQARIT